MGINKEYKKPEWIIVAGKRKKGKIGAQIQYT